MEKERKITVKVRLTNMEKERKITVKERQTSID